MSVPGPLPILHSSSSSLDYCESDSDYSYSVESLELTGLSANHRAFLDEYESDIDGYYCTEEDSVLSPVHAPVTMSDLDVEDTSAAPLIDYDDSYLFPPSSENGQRDNNQTLMEENEMRRKLSEIESSFMPEPPSTINVATDGAGADDTYLVGVGDADPAQQTDSSQLSFIQPITESIRSRSTFVADASESVRVDSNPSMRADNDTTIDSTASSPLAASAIFRDTHRNQSSTSESGKDHSKIFHSRELSELSQADESQLMPSELRKSSRSLSPRLFGEQSFGTSDGRPKFLTTRSDATLGADFTLQSGVSDQWDTYQPTKRAQVARTISLGSMASGVSGYSEDVMMERRTIVGQMDGGLQPLKEEGSPQQQQPEHEDPPTPQTPKAKPKEVDNQSNTVAADRVKGMASTSYRKSGQSPEKRSGVVTPAFAKSGRSMTLKEQSSSIDRFAKENFDLKMRVHFLNEALSKRSDHNVTEMISENIELQSAKLSLQKENQLLKRTIRDLEKQVRQNKSDKGSMLNHDPEASDDADRVSVQEGEIIYLRERIESYELEIERMRSESITKESEKRRLAEMVSSLTKNRATGSEREERDMWKDMLDGETAAREQAEDENRRLRDEAIRLRSELLMSSGQQRSGRERGSTISHERDGRQSMSSFDKKAFVELDLLKQENAELRKEVSAQTSMLTSRNREKERLYQEIEELKLVHGRHGSRSVAGDSILDRSASRAQGRRGSNETSASRSDEERDELEEINGKLRDQLSSLRLENQSFQTQLSEAVSELETLDEAYQRDVDQANEDLKNLNRDLEETLKERDQLLEERDQLVQDRENLEMLNDKLVEERDTAVEVAEDTATNFKNLREEAQDELDALDNVLEGKLDEIKCLNEKLASQEESLKVLKAEMRSATEGILHLEEDSVKNLERYKSVQRDLEDTVEEMESLEKSLFEANATVQRLTVQLESGQNEIAFLREDQEGDKIRIGDLESELKVCEVGLRSEREKTRELEKRLADERHQREVVGGKEKQEVQRMMNDLNREASSAKEDVRRLKKSLQAQEIETSTWRERLMDLENSLRETLGDLSGSRISLISNVTKLQKELETTALELETMRSQFNDKESLLKTRDALLESSALEVRKLTEYLDRERQARRADKVSFEQSLKSHQQASRTLTQNSSRITELENARNQDRKKFNSAKQQLEDQLAERNGMFLKIWKQLALICGAEWSHNNSLINGNLPSQEVIGNVLFWPGFGRNLMLAVKTIENVIAEFKGRIKSVDHSLSKQYNQLEKAYSNRVRRLEIIEEAVKKLRAEQTQLVRLKVENNNLREESRKSKASDSLGDRPGSSSAASATVLALGSRSPSFSSAAEERGLTRANSSSGSENRTERQLALNSSSSLQVSPQTSAAWAYRIQYLEKLLKSERAQNIKDRHGMRQKLKERDSAIERLEGELGRERVRSSLEEVKTRRLPNSERQSSSEGEGGITVDIEV
ncbi:hypothetical protein N7495_009801 [Penicillium taxi]|uniref:uncharacterized protein n=1 Tax=Penicillium taxi TaxID=168475 RepID=UPI0025450475|nr:uncharacterized protein N7495_009801 [Penicillium taxi]KAJ5885291.1 hypothetical protein N7495_009801 [Penicillium taxi]